LVWIDNWIDKLIAFAANGSDVWLFAAFITQDLSEFIDNSGDDMIGQGPALPQFIQHFFLGNNPLVVFDQQQQSVEHLGFKFNFLAILGQPDGVFIEQKWTEFKLLHGLSVTVCGCEL